MFKELLKSYMMKHLCGRYPSKENRLFNWCATVALYVFQTTTHSTHIWVISRVYYEKFSCCTSYRASKRRADIYDLGNCSKGVTLKMQLMILIFFRKVPSGLTTGKGETGRTDEQHLAISNNSLENHSYLYSSQQNRDLLIRALPLLRTLSNFVGCRLS